MIAFILVQGASGLSQMSPDPQPLCKLAKLAPALQLLFCDFSSDCIRLVLPSHGDKLRPRLPIRQDWLPHLCCETSSEMQGTFQKRADGAGNVTLEAPAVVQAQVALFFCSSDPTHCNMPTSPCIQIQQILLIVKARNETCKPHYLQYLYLCIFAV